MARAGGLVCRKIKLKNFYDPKPAGGCGVVPISSAEDLFCHAQAQPAPHCAHDLFCLLHYGLSGVGCARMRLAAREAIRVKG